MTKNEFVETIKKVVADGAYKSVELNLTTPPGRKPSMHLVEMSAWFNELNNQDKEFVRKIIKEAVAITVFSFLCVLDGVSAIEDNTDKGDLKHYYQNGIRTVLLNNPEEEDLHDIFKALIE